MRYRDAGVDVERADAVKARLARSVTATWDPRVRPLSGGFAGVMEWPGTTGAHAPAAPASSLLLAATMDGVGTKMHVALSAGRVADAAADLVYHGANDLLVHGARPLAFLDYLAQGRLDPDVIADAVDGLSRACLEVSAVLLGGETAEMPDTYLPGVIDVAGCMLGTVERSRLLDGSGIRSGDRLLGLGSAGLHTNGFSLARRVLAESGLAPEARLPGGAGESIESALLAPHRWYGPALLSELARGDDSRVHGLAHVTGGGIGGNLLRVLPESCRARIHSSAWPRPALFRWLIDAGRVPPGDARAAFNLGIGMVVVCHRESAPGLANDLRSAGESVFEIGEVEGGAREVMWVDDE